MKKDELIRDIAEALEMSGFRYFIHKETYELDMLPDYGLEGSVDDELFEEFREKLEANFIDYIEIEKLSSRDAFAIMEEFTVKVENKRKQELLYNALQRPKPFRQFRYALEDHDLLEDWYAYKDAYYIQLATTWFQENLNK